MLFVKGYHIKNKKGVKKMEKLNGTSMNLIQENVKKLKEIFPEIFTEDQVDLDLLGELLFKGGGV